MDTFAVNGQRLSYLLDLFGLTSKDFLEFVNSGKKRKLIDEASFGEILAGSLRVNLAFLKKIDALFGKGLNWYLAERPAPKKENSIFFRKSRFASEITIETRKVTLGFEEKTAEIRKLCDNIGFKNELRLKKFSVEDSPEDSAEEVLVELTKTREELGKAGLLERGSDERTYLKNFVKAIEKAGIFVLEYLEHPAKKERVSFDGLFIRPNFLVIKRQTYYSRELFTLAHELGHCLLGEEEIESVNEAEGTSDADAVENWCNRFSYRLLLGEHEKELNSIPPLSEENGEDFDLLVEEIRKKTHLSKSSLYVSLASKGKVSKRALSQKLSEIDESVRRKEESDRRARAESNSLRIAEGKDVPFFPRKKIRSELLKEIARINYFRGNLEEGELCQLLEIKSNEVGREIY